jgi:hypothetical protein
VPQRTAPPSSTQTGVRLSESLPPTPQQAAQCTPYVPHRTNLAQPPARDAAGPVGSESVLPCIITTNGHRKPLFAARQHKSKPPPVPLRQGLAYLPTVGHIMPNVPPPVGPLKKGKHQSLASRQAGRQAGGAGRQQSVAPSSDPSVSSIPLLRTNGRACEDRVPGCSSHPHGYQHGKYQEDAEREGRRPVGREDMFQLRRKSIPIERGEASPSRCR